MNLCEVGPGPCVSAVKTIGLVSRFKRCYHCSDLVGAHPRTLYETFTTIVGELSKHRVEEAAVGRLAEVVEPRPKEEEEAAELHRRLRTAG